MSNFVQDVRYALRTLAKSPAFTAVVVATLALGIGGTTAIFSLVNGILLKPLSYPNPDRLVLIFESIPELRERYPLLPVNAYHFQTWQREAKSFEGLAAMTWENMTLTGVGEPQVVGAAMVSAGFFGTLGVRPRIGRDFSKEEDQPGKDQVAVITDWMWRNRFEADPNIIGRKLLLSGRPFDIIGVLPPGFRFPQPNRLHPFAPELPETEIFKPIAFKNTAANKLGEHNYLAIGRLRKNVTISGAESELNVIQAAISREISQDLGHDQRITASIRPLHGTVVSQTEKGLLLAMGAMGMVLLIACVNIANLTLARATGRHRESAIRAALGAARSRLIRQALTESLCLASVGGFLGAIAAYLLVDFFVAHALVDLPRLDEVSVDWPVLGFAFVAVLASGLLFGLAPAWRVSRLHPQEVLRSGSRGSTEGAKATRLRGLLVSAEVGLSTVLLIGAGLLLHSFFRVMSRDRGFDVENIASVNISLPPAKYGDHQRRLDAYRIMMERMQNLPGVRTVGAVTRLPLTQEHNMNPVLPVEAGPIPMMERPMANMRWTSPDYFQAMGIPLRSGRIYREEESMERPVVISESVARQLWPGEDPIGREMRDYKDKPPYLRVIGVVADVPVASLESESSMIVYWPLWTHPRTSMSVVIRSVIDPSGLAASVRNAVWAVDTEVPVPELKTMEQLVSNSVSERRFDLILVSLFAAAALILACLGVYGVISYSVSQRTNEIGIRMALGARAGEVRRLVLRQGMLPVVLGLTAGLAVAVGLSQLLGACSSKYSRWTPQHSPPCPRYYWSRLSRPAFYPPGAPPRSTPWWLYVMSRRKDTSDNAFPNDQAALK